MTLDKNSSNDSKKKRKKEKLTNENCSRKMEDVVGVTRSPLAGIIDKI